MRHWHCSFGFNFPIVVDANDIVVAGHARLKAALRLELPEVPVVRVDHLTPAEVKALRLADNRLAEEASWDPAKLRIEFEALIIDPAEIPELMESGDFATVGEIAEDENTNLSTVGRVFVEAILAGRQPEGLTMTRAMQPSPMKWRHQILG